MRITDSIILESIETTEHCSVIPGLPRSTEEAIKEIDEVDNSAADEWFSLDHCLDEIEQQYCVYAD